MGCVRPRSITGYPDKSAEGVVLAKEGQTGEVAHPPSMFPGVPPFTIFPFGKSVSPSLETDREKSLL